jgi:hypothetical protein
MEERRSWFERPVVKICDLLLGPPPGRAQLADHLDEATGQLRVELSTRQEVDAELEALRASVAQVRNLVLGGADGPSSLVAFVSTMVKLLEDRIDVAATNGVRWGSYYVLATAVSHFPELKTDLEVPGCAWPWIYWRRMFLLRLLVKLLMARG